MSFWARTAESHSFTGFVGQDLKHLFSQGRELTVQEPKRNTAHVI